MGQILSLGVPRHPLGISTGVVSKKVLVVENAAAQEEN